MSRSSSPSVLIVGAGAAGLLAAIAAAEHGARVTLIERNARPGIKIMMSGGGRCNITNTGTVRELVAAFPGNGRFLHSAFHAFSNDDMIRLLEDEGVQTKVEDRGRVFPASNSARDVVNALVRRAERAGAAILTGAAVRELHRLRDAGAAAGGDAAQGGFEVQLEDGRRLQGDRMIICTGGVSYPTSGSTGDGYVWARRFGHALVPPKPAIVALETVEAWPAQVRGVALRDAYVLVRTDAGKQYGTFPGDVLFTHFGLSGPAALNASHQAVVAQEEAAAAGRGRVILGVRLDPDGTAEAWDERLRAALAEHPRQQVKNLLTRWWPASLAPVLLQLAGVPPEREAAQLPRGGRLRIAGLLHEIPLTLKRPKSIKEAMVTAGGVDVRQVNPKTMGSRLVPGLYFAGEVLDVDGISGGYNLQGAYSTGWVAGRSAALGEQ